MKIELPGDGSVNALYVLRKAGYAYFVDPVTHEGSYVLRLTGGFYPRFHLYLKETTGKVTLDLHLDQKKPSYGTNNAHNGEYDGPTVEKECKRLKSWIDAAIHEELDKVVPIPSKPIKKWSDWFFGQ